MGRQPNINNCGSGYADAGGNSHGVGCPQNEGEESQGSKKLGDLVSAGLDSVGAVQGNVPYDEDVGDASNGVPAPLLGGLLAAVGCKEAGQDHNQVGDDSHEGMGAINASQEAEISQQERRGDGPVDVPSEVDLTADVVVGVGDLVVVRLDLDAVQVGTVTGGHAEVRQSSGDCDERGDDMVETLRHRNVPGQQGEEARGYQHNYEYDPECAEASIAGDLILSGVGCKRVESLSVNFEYGWPIETGLREGCLDRSV